MVNEMNKAQKEARELIYDNPNMSLLQWVSFLNNMFAVENYDKDYAEELTDMIFYELCLERFEDGYFDLFIVSGMADDYCAERSAEMRTGRMERY